MNNKQQVESNFKSELIARLEDKTATIGIIGLGYVGLPLALRYIEDGYTSVVGFEVDAQKVESLNNGQTYIKHISAEKIEEAVQGGFTPTTDYSKISDVDTIILCVPTPLNQYREPDISYITNTMDKGVMPYVRKGQVVSLESTTYPGTTDEEIAARLSAQGFEVGKDIFVVYSPEREDPANPNFVTQTIPKVCGGVTKNCLDVGIALYNNVIDQVVPVSSAKAAEMTKLLENIHRAVNIGLVNEMKIVADKMDIDIFEVIKAAATKPFGFTPYYPGPGLGGHCIPIDPFYLTWKAREYDINTRFIELAGEINSNMPKWVISKIADGLNKSKKSINGSKILLLGLAYKKNVDDSRESPSAEILKLLGQKGAEVNYSDPYVPKFPKMRKHKYDLTSVELSQENLAKYDCVVLVTDHDDFDYSFIQQHSQLVVDTRGKFDCKAANVVRA